MLGLRDTGISIHAANTARGRGTHDPVLREEKITNGGGEVEHCAFAERLDDLCEFLEEPEVVVDGDEFQGAYRRIGPVVGFMVRFQHGEKLRCAFRTDGDWSLLVVGQGILRGTGEQVEEWVQAV